MPEIKIINDTLLPLHISLKQVSPLYYANNVHPTGGQAVFTPGPVWFTIEAKIARIRGEGQPAENEYTRWDTYVPIAAVSVAVLSLGVGAVYVAGTAAATGTISGLITAISADAAATVPTVRRLYKYAKQGQRVVQIGQVIGIGGSTYLTSKWGNSAEAKEQEKQAKKEAAASSVGGSWFSFGGKKASSKKKHSKSSGEPNMTEEELAKKSQELKKHSTEKQAENSTARALRNLLEGSVLSSHGWYMSKDRTLRIVGGPRATEVEGYLVIETDTFEPFRVVDEQGHTVGTGVENVPDPKDAEKIGAAGAVEAGEGADDWKSRLTAALGTASTSTTTALAEWKDYATQQAEAAQVYAQDYMAKRKAGSKEGSTAEVEGKKEGVEETTDKMDIDEKQKEPLTVTASSSNTPAAETETSTDVSKDEVEEEEESDSDEEVENDSPPSSTSSPLDKLEEMGYTRAEARQALLRSEGDFEKAVDSLLGKDQQDAVVRASQSGEEGEKSIRVFAEAAKKAAAKDGAAEGKTEEATPTTKEKADTTSLATPAAEETPMAATAADTPASTTASGTSTPTGPGRLLPVRNAESLTKQGWISSAVDTADAWSRQAEKTPVVGGLIRYGSEAVRKRGEGWLAGGKETEAKGKKGKK